MKRVLYMSATAVVAAFVWLNLYGVVGAMALPDGRAYELVSPPETGAVTAMAGAMGQSDGFDCFETPLSTSDGEGVVFNSDIGALEGLTSNGVLNLYEAHRSSDGWVVESKSASGAQSSYPAGGLCLSPDHQYSTLLTGAEPFDSGSLALNGKETSYVRTPAGAYLLPGAGSSGTDQKANVKWVAAGGTHMIITAQTRLTPDAPSGVGSGSSYETGQAPVNAVYDRTSSGLRVVSSLPDGSVPNAATEATFYRGASADGTAVIFEVVTAGRASLYEHRGNGPSKLIATGAASGKYRYAGSSRDGELVLLLEEGPAAAEGPVRGNLYLFNFGSGLSSTVSAGAEAAVVNLSDDGSHVYFTSEDALPETGRNPLGVVAQPGAPNLYVWEKESGETRFVATVAPEDVDESLSPGENLTEWLRAVAGPQQKPQLGRMNDTSRTNPTGSVIVFQAHSAVTGYDNAGFSEVYRYAGPAQELSCISCPTGSPTANASLQRSSVGPTIGLNALARIQNVTDNGQAVFFMTADPLVPADVNGAVDVYEWEDGGVSLISSGRSELASLLYGMTPSGRDVFFLTNDRLVPSDESSVLSIYDARVGGGFPLGSPAPVCEGEGCREEPATAPPTPSIGSEVVNGSGQAKHHRRRHHRRRVEHRHRHGHRGGVSR